jgi:hypothetical protein
VEDLFAIVFIFGGAALVGLSFSPLGRAVADRLRHGKVPIAAPEVDPAIFEELDHMRAEISEMQERLDFAERLLAKPGAADEVRPV